MDLRPVWGSPIKIKKGIDTNERLRGEAPPVEDTRVLLTLQKHLYRSGLFGTDGQSSKIELARLRRKLGVEPVSAQEAIRVAAPTVGALKSIGPSLGWRSSSCRRHHCQRMLGPNSSRRSPLAVGLRTPKSARADRSRSRRGGWRRKAHNDVGCRICVRGLARSRPNCVMPFGLAAI
jgi:hypothetical protein